MASFLAVAVELETMGICWDEPEGYFRGSEILREWLNHSFQKIKNGEPFSIFEPSFHRTYWPITEVDSLNQVIFNDHPPIPRILPTITWYLFHNWLGEITAYRLSSACLFAGTITITFLLTAPHFGFLVGLFASLALLLSPRFFGHAHFVATDIPLTAFWTFSVFAFYKGLTNCRWSYLFAIALGLTWSVKFTAFMICGTFILYYFLTQDRRVFNNFKHALWLSPLILWGLNPTWWTDPTAIYYNFIKIHFSLDQILIPTYYLGTSYQFDVPWHYGFILTLITLPLPILLTSLVGLASSWNQIWRPGIFSLFWMQLIIFYGTLTFPITPGYDGVRLFLPVFPFLACFAGLGFKKITSWLENRIPSFIEKLRENGKEKFQAGLMAVILLPLSWQLILISPFYLEYYNSLVGGPRGAAKLGFETTYWLDTLSKDVRDDINQLPDHSKIGVIPGYYSYYHNLQRRGLFKKKLYFTPNNPDFVLIIPRQGKFDSFAWDLYKNKDPIYSAKLNGEPIALVYRINQISFKP